LECGPAIQGLLGGIKETGSPLLVPRFFGSPGIRQNPSGLNVGVKHALGQGLHPSSTPRIGAMIPAPPKSFAQLEAQRALLQQQLRSWQELATTWATERGEEFSIPITAAEFFACLAQFESDEVTKQMVRLAARR